MFHHLRLAAVGLMLALSSGWVSAVPPEPYPIDAADLLRPEMFPDPQFGMVVESVHDGSTARIVTTGAEYVLDKRRDTIEKRKWGQPVISE